MLKNGVIRIVLVISSALIIVGVLLMSIMMLTENKLNEIKVQLNVGEIQSLKFNNLAMLPGEEYEYTIKLEKSGASKYDLELDLVDTDKEKTLKNYARVKILANGEVISDELLADAFEKEKIVLPVDFDEGKNTEIKIVYYLPVDVGNEAKNAEAVFELLIAASNE